MSISGAAKIRDIDYHKGSAKRMNLQEGDKIFAVIKSTAVSVEKE